MTKIDFKQMPFEELIPHSPPMVLVDNILGYGDDWLEAQITIKPDTYFFDSQHQGVASWVAIEYMAQAIAALAGIRAKSQGQEVKLGFLLGTRKYHIQQPFLTVNETYNIKVQQLYLDDSGLASFDCSIYQQDAIFAQAKLNVFETDNKNDVMRG
ncbi:MAG: hotdog family protein [Kangiellaceae bacterium]|nr:hotdog family protein [Kangiellaceae bacterium]